MSLDVSIREGNSFTITVALTGKLDAVTAPELDPKLQAVLESPVRVLVMNLEGLNYISSAGLRSLFIAQRAMKSRDGRVLFVNVQPPVQKVFDIVKAVDVSTIFSSVDELDDYLDAMQKKVIEGDD